MTATALDRWPLIGRRDLLDRFGEALGDPAAGGFLVHGDAGVGKTRLADECLAQVERSGAPVGRAVATRTAAALPLGAIAHLLPLPVAAGPATAGGSVPGEAGPGVDPVALFERAREVLADPSGEGRFVLFVDDVHLLDATSSTLLAQLLAAGLIFLVCTVRAGEPVPDLVTALWRDHQVVRVELEPLTRQGVDTLLHLVLGGPIRAAASTELWDASQGNALFLHELVLGAVDAGSLVEVDGVWHLDGLDAGGARLIEIVERRVGLVDAPARQVLDALALCQPLGLAALEAEAGPTVVETLESSGLVVVSADRRRQEVRLSHPLHAEVLRATLPRTQARRVLIAQAERIEAFGARRRDDALRVATWRLDAEGHADPDLLVQAAGVARHAQDFAGTERLARAAHETRPSAIGALYLGEALYELGRFDESEEVLAAVELEDGRLEADDQTVLLLAATRAKNRFWGQLDPDGALAVLQGARRRVSGAGELDELLAEEASIHTFSNRPLEALALLDAIEGADDARTAVVRALVLAPALTAVGRCDEAVRVAERGFEQHVALPDQLALAHPGSHIVAQVFALTDAGRLAEAETLAAAGYEIAAADRSLIAQIWFTLNLGRVLLAQGRLAGSRRWYLEGVGLARQAGFDGPLRLGLAGLAITLGGLDDGAGASAMIAEADELRPFAFLVAEQEIGRAWAEVASGEPARARATLAAAAVEARQWGAATSEARVLHELARLGGAADAADRLAELAGSCDSALVVAWAGHARAVARNDAEELTAAADELERLGLLLVAAETATAASEAWKRRQEQRRANAQAERAGLLAERCEGARTPGLLITESIVALSAREREVASLAAEGVASKDIADRLYLSVRTVNNHLQRVYTKLGVTSRAELADALQRRDDRSPGDPA